MPTDYPPLPEQDGWAVEMHGALVLFANNAEKAAGRSPGAKTPVFADTQMHAYLATERARIEREVMSLLNAYALAAIDKSDDLTPDNCRHEQLAEDAILRAIRGEQEPT